MFLHLDVLNKKWLQDIYTMRDVQKDPYNVGLIDLDKTSPEYAALKVPLNTIIYKIKTKETIFKKKNDLLG